MSKLISFLTSIHVPSDVIAKLQDEADATPLETYTSSYLAERNTYFESTPEFKEKLRTEALATYEKSTLKAIKKINETLGMGLSNAAMEQIKDIDLFMPKAKEFIDAKTESLKNSTNAELITQLNDHKEKASKAINDMEQLKATQNDFIAKTEGEKNSFINSYEAKMFWNKMVQSDNEMADVPGKEFALNAIEKDIFSKYKTVAVKDADNNIVEIEIRNHDDSLVTHPEKATTVKTLKELYPYYKSKAGLMKVSNAGAGAGSPGYVPGAANGGKLGPATKKLMEQFK